VTRRSGMVMSTGGEAVLGRGKRGESVSWAEANLTELKIEEIHVIDSVATIGW
jgi:hypothetical protein